MNLVESLQDHVASHLSLLTPVETIWQPADYLPDLAAEDWHDQLVDFRDLARNLPPDLLVVLVGNMVTEEALPNYAVALNLIVRDTAGVSDSPWSRWLRGWTAEENRHGDLLNTYLRLTGRVDMRSVEQTVHHLIRNGFSAGNEGDDRAGVIYTAFQERATRISHGNLARLADGHGETNIARICRKIAGDETRHEVFYTKIAAEMFAREPEETLLSYRKMLRRIIVMPGTRMTDGRDPDLFEHYAAVAQRTSVYTSLDYASIIRHLNNVWGIAHLSVSGKAAKAQDYLCNQPDRYDALAPEIAQRLTDSPTPTFSWLQGIRS